MDMLVTAGIAFTVKADNTEDAEQMVKMYLEFALEEIETTDVSDTTPIKLWVAGEIDKDARTASLAAKDLRAQTEPEYGLLPAGKTMLEQRIKEMAEEQAKVMADEQHTNS